MTMYLQNEGINLIAVMNLTELSEDLRTKLTACFSELDSYSQLLLFGHAGKRFWQRLIESKVTSPNQVDDRSVQVIKTCLANVASASDYKILYPGSSMLPLQDLGRLSGWHHDSPLGLGIHPSYGLWFAYRGVVLSKTTFTPTVSLTNPSPCLSCKDKNCIATCPAKALSPDRFDVKKCVSYRLTEESTCTAKCIARIACPVGSEHRYAEDQLNYHYSHSLATIKRFSR